MERIESLWSLEYLNLTSTFAFDGDRVLSQVIKLKNSGGLMTDVDLPLFTPTALGYDFKDVLINQYGMTVTTL
jgi:hypothetical protein